MVWYGVIPYGGILLTFNDILRGRVKYPSFLGVLSTTSPKERKKAYVLFVLGMEVHRDLSKHITPSGKSQCEESLPRDQHCVMIWVVKDE